MLGIQCVEVPQYPTHMNNPFDDFEILLLQERIITDNPLLIFCASNAKVITNINNLKHHLSVNHRSILMVSWLC